MDEKSPIPTATYRLQLNKTFSFRDAADIVPYLSALGISHVYVSPYLRARPGSMHGYDIIDHNTLNPEIGTPEDYEHFVGELHAHGMGQILDIVPNHMGVMGSDNAWWLDVLENGEASDYAEFFDIDWEPIKDELQGKVLVPVLGDQYGNVLESGELKLVFDREHGELSIFYHRHRFPIDPGEYPRVLTFQLDRLQEKIAASHADFLELQSIATAFSHLPGRSSLTPEQRAERNREKEVQKRRLAALVDRSQEMREFLNATVELFNGTPNVPRSFDALHDLIKAQAYRLAQWRVAADDINYRRFFDINDLAALRMENEVVFDNTHRFVLELVGQGKIDGLRIDHPDGLYDPAKYFHRLRDRLSLEMKAEGRDFYVIAEKILSDNEQLRNDWPLQGTTGYEFANLVNGLFVDSSAAYKMQRTYESFCGRRAEYKDLVYTCKHLILDVVLASELNVLANLLSRIALANRYTCDFTLNSLRLALAEIIANFPVYRTYVSGRSVADADRAYVEQAVAAAARRSSAADLSVFEFIHRALLVDVPGSEADNYKRAIVRFAMKFQQVTSAAMAKGVEDTAFYRYNRLVSLNEVGGDPEKFGTSVEEFHRANQERLAVWPHSMLSSSTHDSKLSEDVRARINVLSEMPIAWRLAVRRWRGWNRDKKRLIDGAPAPTRHDEYLLYQILVGVWPSEALDDAAWSNFAQRLEQYMCKAAREAKDRTSWAKKNLEYDEALLAFTRALLRRTANNRFLSDLTQFQRRIACAGMFNSLSQTLLKLTAPGVPDIYQGNEVCHFSLVDPDNRRPVDYALRRKLLTQLASEVQSSDAVLNGAVDLKLYLTWKTLVVGRNEAALFQHGNYVPLKVSGKQANHVVAFARQYEGRAAIVAAPRLCAALMGEDFDSVCRAEIWDDTSVEIAESGAACYHNIFTGDCYPLGHEDARKSLPCAKIFRQFPVALLLSDSSEGQGGCAVGTGQQ
jgi:(1->4)-alpha-D-glucan 1-alpha-D-glucosylmutase